MSDGISIAVVILAGGEGRRMGGRKPMQPFAGSMLIDHALEASRSYGGPVAVALRAPEQVSLPPEIPLLLDDPAIEGPIAGLASSLAFGESRRVDAVLTIPCDAPRLPTNLAARLGAAFAPSTRVAVATSGGRLHPTCALWRIGARADLAAYVGGGGRSLKGLAFACGMVAVEWPVQDLDPFANANTQEDLRRLETTPTGRIVGA